MIDGKIDCNTTPFIEYNKMVIKNNVIDRVSELEVGGRDIPVSSLLSNFSSDIDLIVKGDAEYHKKLLDSHLIWIDSELNKMLAEAQCQDIPDKAIEYFSEARELLKAELVGMDSFRKWDTAAYKLSWIKFNIERGCGVRGRVLSLVLTDAEWCIRRLGNFDSEVRNEYTKYTEEMIEQRRAGELKETVVQGVTG